MSAKLLYSLSDENQSLKKQIGCMNGFLQFFDPHHFSPSNRRIPPGENKQEGRAVKNSSKRSKEKNLNAIKEKQVNPIESSRLSISSTASTNISSSEYEWTNKPVQSPFAETVGQERRSEKYLANPSHSSPRQPSSPSKMSHYFQKKHSARDTVPTTCASSPIKTAAREVLRYDQKHMESPRLSNMSRPDSPRLSSLNESFRSISSNHSAPAITPRNKDFARLSYDGRETRNSHASSLKLKELPRLSLDSKQRIIKESSRKSKDDLLLGNSRRDMQGTNNTVTEPQEPMSYRAPSNVVAKLMGLQALPDHDVPSRRKFQAEQDGSCNVRHSDMLSTSSRTINESKIDHVLHSPRSKCKESRVPRSNKAKSEQTPSVDQEAHTEPKSHPLTVYGAIEKRLADLNFQKSGKDLRALKQILESMQKEKNKLDFGFENSSSHFASQSNNSSSFHNSQKQGPEKASPPTNQKQDRSVNEVKSTREIKPTKHLKGSRKEAYHVVQNIPVKSAQRLRVVQEPVDGTKVSVKKKTAKDFKEIHHTVLKYSGERTTRTIIRTSKASEHMTRANSARITDTRSPPATTSSSRLKQSHQTMCYSEFNNDSASSSQQANANLMCFQSSSSMVSRINRVIKNAEESCMKYETLLQVSDDKNPEGIRGDTAFEELKITTVKEQPSPVSVLDANFFEDESPSPVKKKPTVFRDFETNATYTEPEWNYTNLNYTPDGIRPGFSFRSDYQKLENFQESVAAVRKLNSYEHENICNASPLFKEENLEKSYMYEVLLASGFLDHPNYTMVEHLVNQSQEAINPSLFFELEQTRGSSFVLNTRSNSKADRIMRTNERHRRRLLFDAVNEILSQKFSQPKPLLKRQSEISTNGPKLLHEVSKEIDQLQATNLPHSLDDEDDFLTTIIGKDLMRKSANWTDVSGEIPALVLDIERLIFKDLIVELVHNVSTEAKAQKHRMH